MTGKIKLQVNSIVFQPDTNSPTNAFQLRANTFPMMQLRDNIILWREFLLLKTNEILKIFQDSIQNMMNQYFSNLVYSSTDKTLDPNST